MRDSHIYFDPELLLFTINHHLDVVPSRLQDSFANLIFILIKFSLISSDRILLKLPKCYIIKQRGMSVITTAPALMFYMVHCTETQCLLHSTNSAASVDWLERRKMQ